MPTVSPLLATVALSAGALLRVRVRLMVRVLVWVVLLFFVSP